MAALGKAVSKTAAELGEAPAKKKKTKVDELTPVANSRTNGLEYQSSMKRDLTPTELNQKYNVQPSAEYKAYQNDVAATRTGTTASPAPKATNLTTGKVEVPVAVKTEAPKAQGGVTGNKIETPVKKTGLSSGLKTVGLAGLMGAGLVGIPAILEGAANLIPGESEPYLIGSDEFDYYSYLIGREDDTLPGGEYPFVPGGETAYLGGETAYLGGEYYGEEESGSDGEMTISSFFEGAADFISNNLMLIIGIIAAVVILVLVSKSKTTTKSSPSVKRTARKKKGGSHA